MYDEFFRDRLYQLRTQRNVSARDMSLSLRQNPGYINNIESGKALPSMASFFSICNYLNISPSDFFNTKDKNPERMHDIIKKLEQMDTKRFTDIAAIIDDLSK